MTDYIGFSQDKKVSDQKNKIITDYNEFLKSLWLEIGHEPDIKQVINWRSN